ncbi:MAG: hypothetical protein AMXMBFR64_57630 [Myxococcales bacterium]
MDTEEIRELRLAIERLTQAVHEEGMATRLAINRTCAAQAWLVGQTIAGSEADVHALWNEALHFADSVTPRMKTPRG